MTPSITIVTHAGAPDGVSDDHLLAEAIMEAGGDVRYAAWTDASVDWSASAVTVVRSTWDYHLHPAAWFRWLERAAPLTSLTNAPDLIRWNSEKTYLLDLASRGVPVVPTVLLREASDLLVTCGDRGWTDIVVKPSIGASSFSARRFRGAEIASEGVEHTRKLTLSGKALLQPYQPTIENARERSLVYIDGIFCHAFSKPGFYNGLSETELPRHLPSQNEFMLAEGVLAVLPVSPVIARIDLVPADGGPLLMEAELIEPLLALRLCHATSQSLAQSLVRLTGHGCRSV